MTRPRLRADYPAFPCVGADAGRTILAGETRSLVVDDPPSVALLETLDGRREFADVIADLAPRHGARTLASALSRLRRLGVVVDGPAAAEPAVAAWWDALGVNPSRAQEWLERGTLTVVDGAGPGAAASIVAALAGVVAHVGTVGLGDPDAALPPGPLLCLVDDLRDKRLAAFDAARRADGRDWVLARPRGAVVIAGPHFVPGRTGCWHCLDQRWAANDQVTNFLLATGRSPADAAPARARSAVTGTVLAGLLAAQLPAVAVNRYSPALTGRLVACDARELSTSTHELVRQPQCPDCGDPAAAGSGPRVDITAATERAAEPPGMTYRRLAHHVSEYTGVATRVVSLTGDDEDLVHAYSSAHSFVPVRRVDDLRETLRGVSGGKGPSAEAARMGALGEAIERYCGVWRGDRPAREARLAELPDGTAVPLQELHGFSAQQYARRDVDNRTRSHLHRVPRPVGDDEVMAWSPAWSILADQPRWLPAAYCWYGHPDTGRLGASGSDSNGCAAAGSLAAAVVAGFGELVERDAVALWWQHRSRVPGLDLDSFADLAVDRVRTHFDTVLDRDLWALDVTTDLGVPAFVTVSAHRSRPTQDVLVGFGAAFDPRVALERALREVTQFLPTVARFERGRTYYGMRNPEALRWFGEIRVEEQPWLRPAPGPPSTSSTYPQIADASAADAVKRCLAVADAAGLDVIVVDQSRPDIDLAVARVVVPGLRHFWRRLGPGRLWTVPPRLGRSPLAATEDDVNPFDLFF